MSEFEIDWSKIEDHPVNAVRFFKIMMRLEYALKDRGFARGSEKWVRVNWERYASDELGPNFLKELLEGTPPTVLLCEPPSRQIIQPCGRLGWDRANPIESTKDILEAVWRVRNNLFHGGKSGDPDRVRNDDLIADSIAVISEILRQDEELHALFAGWI